MKRNPWEIRGSTKADPLYDLSDPLGFRRKATLKLSEAEKEILANPRSSSAYVKKGDALITIGQPNDALDAYDKAIQINPYDSDGYQGRGRILSYLKKYKESITAYNQAIYINPNDGDTYDYKGDSLKELKRYEEAIAAYKQALEHGVFFPQWTYCSLGNVFNTLKRYWEALSAFDQATSIVPQYIEAQKGKVVALRGLGNHREASAVEEEIKKIEASVSFRPKLNMPKNPDVMPKSFEAPQPLTEARVREIAREVADEAILEHPAIRLLQKEGVKKSELEALIVAVIQTRQEKRRWGRQPKPLKEVEHRIQQQADKIVAQVPEVRNPLKEFISERVMNATDPERVFNAFLPLIAVFGPQPFAPAAVAVVQSLNTLFSKRVTVEEFGYRQG